MTPQVMAKYLLDPTFYLFRPGVRLVIDPGQMLKIQMGIYLGRTDVRMAQKFLYRP